MNRKKHGFTLIELLVVISIIAVLMAIMMPALSRVRENARSTICRSNLKQIVLAATLWAADNDDRAVAANWHGSGRASIGKYTNADREKEGDLYVCASARGNTIYDKAGSGPVNANYEGRDLVCTYGANGYMVWNRGQKYTPGKLYSSKLSGSGAYHHYQRAGDWYHDNRFGATKLSGIYKPSQTAYFMDHEYSVVVEWVMDPRTDNPLSGSSPMTMPMGTRWHSIPSGEVYGYGNIAWVDGSATVEPDDFGEVDEDGLYEWTKYFAGTKWLRSPHD